MTSQSPEQPDESALDAGATGESALSSGSSGTEAGADSTSTGAYSAASPSPYQPTPPPPPGQQGGYQAPPPYAGQQQGGYQPPPQQGGYPPPPQQGSYQQPPQQGSYQQPPQQGSYQQPPQQGGYAPPPPAYPNQPGYPPQQYAGPPAGQQPMTQSDERLWATLSHISIPFIGVIGPLIVYLVFKDRSAFLKDQGTESLNFSILYTIAQIVSSILVFAVIGSILIPLLFIAALVLCIMAAIAANKGEAYRYPVNWRMIK